MIVDTSAVIAVLRGEPDADAIIGLLVANPGSRMSAASNLEAGIVVDSARDPVATRQLDAWLEGANITVAPVSVGQARIARASYRDFGKGSGHPAGLNFGDCFTYALAVESGEPLLYNGDDFRHTDVTSALPT